MINTLWKEVIGGISKNPIFTAISSFGPSIFFWFSCLALYTYTKGLLFIEKIVNSKSTTIQILYILAGLFIIFITTLLLEQFSTSIARIYEGYWLFPFNNLANLVCKTRQKRFIDLQKKFNELNIKNNKSELSFKDKDLLLRIDYDLSLRPSNSSEIMATRLGDILKAAEEHSHIRYGIDAIVTWPRIYPLIKDDLKTDISTARLNMDMLLRYSFVSALLAFIWGIICFSKGYIISAIVIMTISFIISYISYSGAIQAALIYGDIIRSVFDLYRFDLYKALHWPLPKSLEDEINSEKPKPLKQGEILNQFLYRGFVLKNVIYKHPNRSDE